jgi:hypothetical protein
MEKYLDAWNTVNRSYLARMQKEGVMMQGAGAMGAGPAAGEKELF